MKMGLGGDLHRLAPGAVSWWCLGLPAPGGAPILIFKQLFRNGKLAGEGRGCGGRPAPLAGLGSRFFLLKYYPAILVLCGGLAGGGRAPRPPPPVKLPSTPISVPFPLLRRRPPAGGRPFRLAAYLNPASFLLPSRYSNGRIFSNSSG